MSHHPVKREETYSKTRQPVSKWKEWSRTSLELMPEFIQLNRFRSYLENKVESEVKKYSTKADSNRLKDVKTLSNEEIKWKMKNQFLALCRVLNRWPLNHHPSGTDISCNRWFYKISAQHWPKSNQVLPGLKTNQPNHKPRNPPKKNLSRSHYVTAEKHCVRTLITSYHSDSTNSKKKR